MKGSEGMNEMNVTEALLKAILELIEKCETLEELRESVKRIMHVNKKSSGTDQSPATRTREGEPGALPRPP